MQYGSGISMHFIYWLVIHRDGDEQMNAAIGIFIRFRPKRLCFAKALANKILVFIFFIDMPCCEQPDEKSGCATLFINYLSYQL
jgi:hypothetical protein